MNRLNVYWWGDSAYSAYPQLFNHVGCSKASSCESSLTEEKAFWLCTWTILKHAAVVYGRQVIDVNQRSPSAPFWGRVLSGGSPGQISESRPTMLHHCSIKGSQTMIPSNLAILTSKYSIVLASSAFLPEAQKLLHWEYDSQKAFYISSQTFWKHPHSQCSS